VLGGTVRAIGYKGMCCGHCFFKSLWSAFEIPKRDRTLQCNIRYGICPSPSHRIILHPSSTGTTISSRSKARLCQLTERVAGLGAGVRRRQNKHTELRRRLPLFKLYPVPGQPAPLNTVPITPAVESFPDSFPVLSVETVSLSRARLCGMLQAPLVWSAVKEPQALQDSAMGIHRTGGQGLPSDCQLSAMPRVTCKGDVGRCPLGLRTQ
jgi:hypothetical protein